MAALRFLFSPLGGGILAALALAALAAWAAHALRAAGDAACETRHRADLAAHIQRAAEQARVIAKQDAEVSEYYERWRTKIEAHVITVKEEVAREIPADCRTCSLTPDGLRRLNDALRGVPPPASDSNQPDGGVPAPAKPERWQLPGGGRPLGADGPSLRKLRSPAQPAGATAQGA